LSENDLNLGLAARLNSVMAAVDTELVVVAAGDDNSLPHRVSRFVDALSIIPGLSCPLN